MNIIVTGGFEANFALGFIKGLAESGVPVLVVSCDRTSPSLTAAGIPNINLRGSIEPDRPAAAKVINLGQYYARLLFLVARNRGATVHFIGMFRNNLIWFEGTFLHLWLKVFSGRYLYTVHNALPHSRENNRVFRWLYRQIYRIPDVLLVHTTTARRQMIEEFDVESSRLCLTSIGLNEEIPATTLTRNEVRQYLGYVTKEQLVLFFGKIDEYKGLDILLEAFERLRLEHSKLIVAGVFRSGAYRARIQDQLAKMTRRCDVRLQERFIPNNMVEIYFKAADVLCLPYRNIYQSGLIFLAPRFGVPMVTTDVGGFRDFIGPGDGVIARTNDAAGIAEALEQFFENPQRFSPDEIRERAQKYRWHTICKGLAPLYSNGPVSTVPGARRSLAR